MNFAKFSNQESMFAVSHNSKYEINSFWFKIANDFKIISWRYSGNKERVTMAQIFQDWLCFLNLTRSILWQNEHLTHVYIVLIIEIVITGPQA
jgi:hypothetical protein